MATKHNTIGSKKTFDKEGNEISSTPIKGNEDFTMIFNRHLKSIREIAAANAPALQTFTVLIELMDNMNAVDVSMDTLSAIIGLSRQAISKHVKYLAANGFVQVARTSGSYVYYINADVVWKNKADKIDFAVMKTNVVMSVPEFGKKNPKPRPKNTFEGRKHKGKGADDSEQHERPRSTISDTKHQHVKRVALK